VKKKNPAVSAGFVSLRFLRVLLKNAYDDPSPNRGIAVVVVVVVVVEANVAAVIVVLTVAGLASARQGYAYLRNPSFSRVS
jgi:hypothetical protein